MPPFVFSVCPEKKAKPAAVPTHTQPLPDTGGAGGLTEVTFPEQGRLGIKFSDDLLVEDVVEGGLAGGRPELRPGMVLTHVAGREVESLEDAHYFFSAASWPLTLVFKGAVEAPPERPPARAESPPTRASERAPDEAAEQDTEATLSELEAQKREARPAQKKNLFSVSVCDSFRS